MYGKARKGSERRWIQIETRDVQAGYKGKLSHDEDSPGVGQASQRGCVVSIPGVFQDLTERSPKQPGLISELALLCMGGWTGDLLSSLPAGTIL